MGEQVDLLADDAPRSGLLTRTEAATFLRVSPSTFDAHVRRALPCVRIGRMPRWDVRDLEAWIDVKREEDDAPETRPTRDVRASRPRTPPPVPAETKRAAPRDPELDRILFGKRT